MVVDEGDKVIGIISLSDLLLYLVLRPCGEDDSPEGMSSVRAQVTFVNSNNTIILYFCSKVTTPFEIMIYSS